MYFFSLSAGPSSCMGGWPFILLFAVGTQKRALALKMRQQPSARYQIHRNTGSGVEKEALPTLKVVRSK